MKSERFTLFVLLVEILAIGFLHSEKTGRSQAAPPQTTVTAVQKPLPASVATPATTTWQWNNNFTLIRLK
ncbi:hypothetical protein HB364_24870 [Pseudoflavitalea sp. X16]|uniref:hypothetical protein n=1 Tax=Paraflavitalea devenefica TaxID=2716334 RepID=UPI00142155D4|nr:hypothetical protein [Paraflavitalea devenefica]NII28339.1 hypothetical protein [Paraflavitalea devenefica]